VKPCCQCLRPISSPRHTWSQAITSDPSICRKSLAEQFRKLIYEPLDRLGTTHHRPIYIIVVDALDECEGKAISTILELWSNLPRVTNPCLRLLVTSRPELSIVSGFDDVSLSTHLDVNLYHETRSAIKSDLLVPSTRNLKSLFPGFRSRREARPYFQSPCWRESIRFEDGEFDGQTAPPATY